MKVSELIQSLEKLRDQDAEIILKDMSEPDLEFKWVELEVITITTVPFERGQIEEITETSTTILKGVTA